MIPMALLSKRNLEKLQASTRITGVVVVPGSPAPPSWSPDVNCPNCGYTQYANGSWGSYNWNPKGTGLNFASWDFPIFAAWPTTATANKSLNAILQGVQYNAAANYASYPLYSVDFDALMYAAVNSPTCLRRQFCDPVGGYSVWSTPKPAVVSTSPIVLVAATLDASSFFHELASGVATHVGGMVAAMVAADAISNSPTPARTWNGTVLFGFFNAEQWGHAGSQRFARDITNFTCLATSGTKCPLTNGQCKNPCVANLDFTNISIKNIAAIIELNQLAPQATNLYMHVDIVDTKTIALLNQVRAAGADQTLKPSDAVGAGRLPPSASLAFLQQRSGIPAVVLSDFNAEFATPYFNSELDYPPQTVPDAATVCAAATITARTVYRLANNLPPEAPVPPQLNANCSLAAELLGCFSSNFSCPTVLEFLNTNLPFYSSYASVFNYGGPTPLVYVVNQFMKQRVASATGPACNKTSDCSALPNSECISNLCTLALSRLHQAYGTGLAFNSDSGYFEVVNGNLGTWTESRWTRTGMRVFKVASLSMQIGELVGGIGVLGASVGAWYAGKGYLKKRLTV